MVCYADMAGRPTSLNEELITQSKTYLDECSGVGTNTLLPTIEGLALAVKISRETVYAWEEQGKLTENNGSLLERFSDIVKELRSAQAQKLMQNSLHGRYNPMIAKLLLSKHGYVEKSETDVTSKGEQITGTVDPAMAAGYAKFINSQSQDE